MRNRNPIFTMPPSEQTTPAPVEGMIHVDAADYWRAKHQLEELRMRVAELSGKVDTLISLATNYKSAADSQQAAQLPQDDPEVEALAHRIDDAIAVLQGSKTVTDPTTPGVPAGSTPLGTTGVDPNAPV
jgi:hypothetical protein